MSQKTFSDVDLRHYVQNGFIVRQTDLPPSFHAGIWQQAESIFEAEGNPRNEIYPRIPELITVFDQPDVRSALSGVLGEGYIMHPHRHCHQTPQGKDAQRNHKDSYPDDANVRHHRSRWAMAFYYPQNVDVEIGPTAVTPKSQYFTEPESLDALEERSVLGRAGTVAIVHFDIWHRAYRNITSGNRYMMKFLFCRTREPDHILRRSAPPEFESLPAVCDDLWRWYSGQDTGPQMDASSQELWSGSEPEHIEASYRLGRSGQVEALMEHLFEEAAAKRERNWDPRHTNLAQFDSSYGLVAAGSKAVPAIKKAVESQDEAVRAAAVDILGDIGQMAGAAVPDLIDALEDDSEWVRRNATEALGNLAAEDASMALGGRLDDESDRVRHNAALSLIKVGKPAEKVLPELRTARDDGNRYVREISRLACDRLMR